MPTDTEVRVQIAVPGHVIDVPMSHHMLIGDCLAELIPFIRRELDLRGKDASWLDDTKAHWVLRRPFRSAHLDEAKTLHDEGILDGSRLLLVKKTSKARSWVTFKARLKIQIKLVKSCVGFNSVK